MEKEIGSKEVKMGMVKHSEAKPQSTVEPEKLSYEKLNEIAAQLSQQNQQMDAYIKKLHAQMQDMAEVIRDKRIDYLFKVLEYSAAFRPEFTKDCAAEIQQMLTPPVEEDNKEEVKEG